MARQENDREDLLREATALVERAEWEVSGFAEPIVAGFRRSGSASFFFSAEPVYQFNEAGEFRRGYWQGKLMKAEQGQLASLTRVRTAHTVQLQRRDLGESETAAYLAEMERYLQRLQESLAAGEFVLIGEHPPHGNVTNRVLAWLAQRSRPATIAQRPNA